MGSQALRRAPERAGDQHGGAFQEPGHPEVMIAGGPQVQGASRERGTHLRDTGARRLSRVHPEQTERWREQIKTAGLAARQLRVSRYGIETMTARRRKTILALALLVL